MSDDQKAAKDPAKGGYALMLPIEPMAPGWEAVQNQAVDCGMTVKAERHITLVFFGRDLKPARRDLVLSATNGALTQHRDMWRRDQLRRAGVDHVNGCDADGTSGVCSCNLAERIERFDFVQSFIPVRFTGEILTFENRTASHVVASVEPKSLQIIRQEVIDRYGSIREDFGGWKPHVTLAEGPAGTRLKRPAETPRCATSVTSVLLKLGQERQALALG